ncbi:MAG: hypothetical protein AAGB51_13515 [Planctomycetota bacterium]
MHKAIRTVRAYFWVFVVCILIGTAIEYAGYVGSETTSVYRDNWLAWLGYTLAGMGAVVVLLFGAHLIGPRTGPVRFGIDLAAAAASVPTHLVLTGPVADRVFWDGTVEFEPVSLIMLLPLAVVYLLSRGATWAASAGWQRLGARRPA